MNKKKIFVIIIIAVVAISIGLYTILPLFTNTIVDEPLPTASGMISGVLDDEKLKQMHQV
jgi:flagellar basal body-associated protein FliL